MRTPPHSGRCERCEGLIIDAFVNQTVVRLDAEPVTDGAYRAWNRGDVWIAQVHDAYKHFSGLRVREHVCVVPDKQLELA